MLSALRSRIRFRRQRSGYAPFLPKARTATWRGWPANADRRASPRAMWSNVRSVIMLGVNYGPQEGPRADPLAILQQPHARRHFRLCARRRLSRRDQAAAQEPWTLADRKGRRRHQSVRRYRRRDGEAAGRGLGHRLAGQTHKSRVAAIRLVAVPRRDFHHARSAAGHAGTGSLRQLPRLPRHLPDRRIPRAVSSRCAALHFLSHHRA